jgi:hypothetical protein
MQKPCLGNGGPCPTRNLTTHRSGRCEHCRRASWRARGTTAERGYGADHERLRARWAPIVAAGRVNCARCHEQILPADAWDLGHSDTDRTQYGGPEHRACNRATRSRGSW